MHECACCGESVYADDEEDLLCSCCVEAGCDDAGGGCEVPMCLACETPATFCTDKTWHSNCDCTEED